MDTVSKWFYRIDDASLGLSCFLDFKTRTLAVWLLTSCYAERKEESEGDEMEGQRQHAEKEEVETTAACMVEVFKLFSSDTLNLCLLHRAPPPRLPLECLHAASPLNPAFRMPTSLCSPSAQKWKSGCWGRGGGENKIVSLLFVFSP